MEPAMTWLNEAPMPTALDVGEEKIQPVQTAQRPPRRDVLVSMEASGSGALFIEAL
jgi:hypothetical protein